VRFAATARFAHPQALPSILRMRSSSGGTPPGAGHGGQGQSARSHIVRFARFAAIECCPSVAPPRLGPCSSYHSAWISLDYSRPSQPVAGRSVRPGNASIQIGRAGERGSLG
jgi:hypothetical protein